MQGSPTGAAHLLPVLLVLDGVHRAARLGIEHEVEARILAEAASVAEEGVFLVIIDGPGKWKVAGLPGQLQLRPPVSPAALSEATEERRKQIPPLVRPTQDLAGSRLPP